MVCIRRCFKPAHTMPVLRLRRPCGIRQQPRRHGKAKQYGKQFFLHRYPPCFSRCPSPPTLFAVPRAEKNAAFHPPPVRLRRSAGTCVSLSLPIFSRFYYSARKAKKPHFGAKCSFFGVKCRCFFLLYRSIPIKWTTHAATHAMAHCHSATPAAHFAPSSLLMEAIAATHGV